jgi:protein-L-isoaspartate(D-aspartate) O-methyltransferase
MTIDYFMSLINDLITGGYLKSPAIISAFKKIKRHDFVRPEDAGQAEIDAPLGIGRGQTISQPATVAFMLEKLRPKRGEKILDVGSGSGWTAALLADIIGSEGKVYGLERIRELADFAINNINKYNFIKKGSVQIFCTDGYRGLPEFAPFDKMLISAAAELVPDELLKELRVGGRLVIPIGEKFQTQSIKVIEKIGENRYNRKSFPGFVFVPLVKDN